MNASPPWVERPKQRSAVITDEAWTRLLEHAVRVKKSASLVCRELLADYLSRPQKPPLYAPDPDWPRATRSVYIPDELWEAARLEMIQRKHSVSKLLEQLIRGHLGLAVGQLEQGAPEQKQISDSPE